MSKKVLAVDDRRHEHDLWRRDLGDKVELISAFSIKEAEELFASNPDIVAIVMDACVPGDEPTTPPLVQKFRRTFTGPMIAVSGNSTFREELMEAGCDYQCVKGELPEMLLIILSL